MSKIMDGKRISEQIKEEVKQDIIANKRNIKLVVIQVGDNQASNIYVRNKQKACEYVGIEAVTLKLSQNISQKELVKLIWELNSDDTVNGILVQLPLPKHIDGFAVLNMIENYKDVDGFTYINRGKLASGRNPRLKPCTPAGIIELIKRHNILVQGKQVVIIGRSNIVGRPMAEMFIEENATVTVLHSYSKLTHTIYQLSNADIIVSATGNANFILPSMISGSSKPILIDVGMNRDSQGKLCGDISTECYNFSSYYTPVPGGVGPMTIAMLMKNCLEAHKIWTGEK